MKNILSILTLIVCIFISGCSSPREPEVSDSDKAKFKEQGIIIVNVTEFASKDGTIVAKLPSGYLKLNNTRLDQENLLLLNTDTKESIVLSFTPAKPNETLKYNENDTIIRNKLNTFHTKFPDLKSEFTAQKISGKWFWVSMSKYSNGYSTMNNTNIFHLTTTSHDLEKDAQYILSNLIIKN